MISITWLDNSVSDAEINIEDYTVVRKDRNRNGTDVCVYIRNDFAFSVRSDLQTDNDEILFVELLVPKTKPIIIVELLVPKTKPIIIVELLLPKTKPIIIVELLLPKTKPIIIVELLLPKTKPIIIVELLVPKTKPIIIVELLVPKTKPIIIVELLVRKTKPIIIGTVYRPPKQNDFLNNFEEILTNLRSDCETLLLGDLNICYLQRSSSSFICYLQISSSIFHLLFTDIKQYFSFAIYRDQAVLSFAIYRYQAVFFICYLQISSSIFHLLFTDIKQYFSFAIYRDQAVFFICYLQISSSIFICYLQRSSSIFKAYANILKRFDLDQIITEPTRITDTTTSLLDHILCNNKEKSVSPVQFLLVCVTMFWLTAIEKYQVQIHKHKYVKIRSLKNYKKEDFILRLTGTNWGQCFNA